MNEEPPYIESTESIRKLPAKKGKLFTVFLGIIALIIPFPLHYTGLAPLIFNDTGATYLPLPEILLWTAFIFACYFGYFKALKSVLKVLLEKHKFPFREKIFMRFSAVLPLLFCFSYFATYQPNSIPAKLMWQLNETLFSHSINSLETKFESYDVLADFTISQPNNASISFRISEDGEKILSKTVYLDVFEYRPYLKLSHEDFWYLLNTANRLYMENPEMNREHLPYVDLKSNHYFTLKDIDFVSVAYPMKDFLVLTEFIQIGNDYYMADFGSYLNSEWESKYQKMVQMIWANRSTYSDDFFKTFGSEQEYFSLLIHPDQQIYEEDFFKIHDTPLVYLNPLY